MEVIERQQTKEPQQQGEDLLYVGDLVFLRRGVKIGKERKCCCEKDRERGVEVYRGRDN